MATIYYLIFILIFMTLGVAILEFLFWAIEKSFNYLKEYFYPTLELPDEILDAIEQEADDFFWNMHRVDDELEIGEYYRVLQYFYNKKYAEYFSS